MLYKYLIKYSSDHGYNGYKNVCQRKLLKSGKIETSHASRQFPPTMLEYRANKKRVNQALDAHCADRYSKQTAVDSFTTAEEFAGTLLKNRGIPELQGWTVSLEEEDMAMEVNGGDFVLDVIGQIEVAPSFPVKQGSFLVTTDRSKGQLPLLINTGPHNYPSKFRYGSASPAERTTTITRNQRARSQDRLLAEYGNEEFGLSKSALNERYFGEKNATKSRSLDNLLGGETAPDSFGLSQSRLNKRYRNLPDVNQFISPEDLEMESISQRGGARDKWDDIGLSKTPINERYFSQPDLDKVNAQPSEADGRRFSENAGQRTRSQSNITKLDGIEIPNFEYAANPEELRGTSTNQGPSGIIGANAGGLPGGGRKLHGHPRYVKGQGRRGRYDKSSAMSDTSEAPSIASHVRGVRVPSQASDVDQFLDDLFMPVLDGTNDDGLSDARSLAASMRGGGGAGEGEELSKADNDLEIQTFSRQNSLKRRSVLKQGLGDLDWKDLEIFNHAEDIAQIIKGGKDGTNDPNKDQEYVPANSPMGFQPIPGVVSPTPNMSGMMSPPPMLMPTPVHSLMNNAQSLTSPLFMQGPHMGAGYPGSTTPDPNAQPAMAFTYVPVPVYNMGGMSLPGFQGMMPPGTFPPSGIISPEPMSPVPPKVDPHHQQQGGQDDRQRNTGSATPADQSAQQMAYQQAFLQNAVAQNMQIQQQLLMQNQALTQLLQQSVSGSNNMTYSSPMQSMTMQQNQTKMTTSQSTHAFGLQPRQTSVEREPFKAGRLTETQLRTQFEEYQKHHGEKLRLSEHQVQECYQMFCRQATLSDRSDAQVQEAFQDYLKDLHLAQVHQSESEQVSPYDKLTEQELHNQYKEYLKQNQGDQNHDQLTETEFRKQFQAQLSEQFPQHTFFGMSEDGQQQRRISADQLEGPGSRGHNEMDLEARHKSKSFPNTPKISSTHAPDPGFFPRK